MHVPIDDGMSSLHVHILGYELGWEEQAQAMGGAVQAQLGARGAGEQAQVVGAAVQAQVGESTALSCSFGHCDITLPLADPANSRYTMLYIHTCMHAYIYAYIHAYITHA